MRYIIEGPDGSGKTTIAKMLAERMKVPYLRCPGSTKLGEMLRPVLKNEMMILPSEVKTLLFAAVDLDCMGTSPPNCVLDRSGLSNLVYRKAENNFQMARKLCDMNIDIFLPMNSVVVILDADDKVLDQRLSWRTFDNDDDRFMENVRSAYRSLKAMNNHIVTMYSDIMTPEEICHEIQTGELDETDRELLYQKISAIFSR